MSVRVKNWKPPVFSKDFVVSVPYVHATEYPSEIKSMRMNYVLTGWTISSHFITRRKTHACVHGGLYTFGWMPIRWLNDYF